MTREKQHTNRYNCISNNSLDDAIMTPLYTLPPPPPKNTHKKQQQNNNNKQTTTTNTKWIYINKCMNITAFYFALLNFLSDSLILKVRSLTTWFEWNAEKNHASLLKIWIFFFTETVPKTHHNRSKKCVGVAMTLHPLEYFLTLSCNHKFPLKLANILSLNMCVLQS